MIKRILISSFSVVMLLILPVATSTTLNINIQSNRSQIYSYKCEKDVIQMYLSSEELEQLFSEVKDDKIKKAIKDAIIKNENSEIIIDLELAGKKIEENYPGGFYQAIQDIKDAYSNDDSLNDCNPLLDWPPYRWDNDSIDLDGPQEEGKGKTEGPYIDDGYDWRGLDDYRDWDYIDAIVTVFGAVGVGILMQILYSPFFSFELWMVIVELAFSSPFLTFVFLECMSEAVDLLDIEKGDPVDKDPDLSKSICHLSSFKIIQRIFTRIKRLSI